MTRFAFFLAVTCAFGGSAGAFEVSNLERCRKIDADSARLACFDAVTAELGTSEVGEKASAPPPVTSTDTGAWEVSVEVDPITDEKVITAAVESDAQSASFRKPILFVRCKAKDLEVFIAWTEYLADETSVTTRIDESDPETSRWEQSTDQTATFAVQPKETIEALREAERYSARITPYRSGPVTASFPVTGLDAILTTHEGVCGQIGQGVTAPAP
jgi:hypothetical protein